MKKFVKIIALLLALSVSAFSAGAVYTFTDIKNHWAKGEIAKLAEKDILQGENGLFRPDDQITRGEMAVVMMRLLNLSEEAEDIFKDLDDGFYRHAVLCCFKVGVMKGDHKIDNEKKAFRPHDPISREEAALTLCRAFALTERADGAKAFSDADQIALWSIGAVGALADLRVLMGREDGAFDPKTSVTRAEIARMIVLLEEKAPSVDLPQ